MNRIRHGKIARLPQRLREELNRRLDQGAQGGPLLQWLNSQPEVQAVLAADFGGRPINKQSLSQWRRGGYAEWLRLQEAQALAGPMPAETRESPPLADQMAAWAAARGLLAVRELAGPGGTEAAPLKTLREACRDLVALRQENHTAARAQFELARCQLLRACTRPCGALPGVSAKVFRGHRGQGGRQMGFALGLKGDLHPPPTARTGPKR